MKFIFIFFGMSEMLLRQKCGFVFVIIHRYTYACLPGCSIYVYAHQCTGAANMFHFKSPFPTNLHTHRKREGERGRVRATRYTYSMHILWMRKSAMIAVFLLSIQTSILSKYFTPKSMWHKYNCEKKAKRIASFPLSDSPFPFHAMYIHKLRSGCLE